MTLREQARVAVAHAVRAEDRHRHITPTAADAASDIWEPIATTLRDHTPIIDKSDGTRYWWCEVCGTDWPCPEWQRAAVAIDG